jgi:hypothetical protein
MNNLTHKIVTCAQAWHSRDAKHLTSAFWLQFWVEQTVCFFQSYNIDINSNASLSLCVSLIPRWIQQFPFTACIPKVISLLTSLPSTFIHAQHYYTSKEYERHHQGIYRSDTLRVYSTKISASMKSKSYNFSVSLTITQSDSAYCCSW